MSLQTNFLACKLRVEMFAFSSFITHCFILQDFEKGLVAAREWRRDGDYLQKPNLLQSSLELGFSVIHFSFSHYLLEFYKEIKILFSWFFITQKKVPDMQQMLNRYILNKYSGLISFRIWLEMFRRDKDWLFTLFLLLLPFPRPNRGPVVNSSTGAHLSLASGNAANLEPIYRPLQCLLNFLHWQAGSLLLHHLRSPTG